MNQLVSMFGLEVAGSIATFSARYVTLLVAVAMTTSIASPARKSLTNQPNNTSSEMMTVNGVVSGDCIVFVLLKLYKIQYSISFVLCQE